MRLALHLTQHAEKRLQQRGIRPEAVDLLMSFGTVEVDHNGACNYYIDKCSRRRVENQLGGQGLRQLEAIGQLYLVVNTDGEVITVGHRQRRIYHDRKPGSFPWAGKY